MRIIAKNLINLLSSSGAVSHISRKQTFILLEYLDGSQTERDQNRTTKPFLQDVNQRVSTFASIHNKRLVCALKTHRWRPKLRMKVSYEVSTALLLFSVSTGDSGLRLHTEKHPSFLPLRNRRHGDPRSARTSA